MERKQARDDREIIRDIKNGVKTAIDELIKKYQKRVYNALYGMTMNYDAAWDISQEVFVKVVRNIENFRGDSSFWTYVYRIAMNAHYDYRRREKVRSRVSNFTDMEREDDDRQFEVKDLINVEEDFDVKMMKECITKAMEELTEVQKEVFMLKNTEGFKIREISRLMKISEGTVKSHLNRAIEKIKAVVGVMENEK